ncbi:MAG: TRAP transporter small permease [Tenuifilaceae bacterium]|jgi:TRAP-type C4-dicarboxylate transport system permease small subunit|nr:TRAP transporter small permease [Tenuifilaceae bacterium]
MKHRAIIDKLLGWLVTIFMGVLVINVLWQVTSRFVVGHPSSFTDELAGYLLIWVGLLGAAYATGQKQHLAIDLISRKMSPQRKRVLDTTINSLIIIFAIFVLIIGGSNLVYITFHLNQISSALQLPVGFVYSVIPISGIFIIYYAVTDIIMLWQVGTDAKQVEN